MKSINIKPWAADFKAAAAFDLDGSVPPQQGGWQRPTICGSPRAGVKTNTPDLAGIQNHVKHDRFVRGFYIINLKHNHTGRRFRSSSVCVFGESTRIDTDTRAAIGASRLGALLRQMLHLSVRTSHPPRALGACLSNAQPNPGQITPFLCCI